ncbi:hypothetical protein JXB41_07310 [Candidatus Woesearchaeota archaeon]|nr:hypothetical protein [Candidatus Woesearchaeota archaeon]
MRRYTKEQLIHFLKKLSKELKKTPTADDINKKKKYPCSSTYVNRFGSWNNALKQAGLKLNIFFHYNKKELIDNLKQIYKELGRVPKSKDIKGKKWMASYSTYKKYFGSWNNALNKAGIKKTSEYNSLREFIKKKK